MGRHTRSRCGRRTREAGGVGAKPVGFPPENLSVAVADGSVTLSWDAPAADAVFVTGYEVLRRQPRIDGRGVFHAIATTGAVARTYVDGSVEAGEKYAYRVKAWRGTDLGLWSGWANIVAPQVPAAPANLSAAAGDGTVTLTWDDADDDTIADYQYRSRTGMTWSPDWTDIDPSDENTTSHTLRGLTNGTEHTFEVRAINANGNGTTASVTATPVSPPSAPANLTATAGSGSVTLAWDNPNDGTITGYQVRFAPGGGNDTPDWTRIEWSDVAGSDFSTTGHEVTGLTNGTAYVFQVRALNPSGDGSLSSAAATPFPAAPANLEASVGVREVTLEWDDPGDAAITVYQLKYGHGTTVVQDWSDIAGTSATTTSHEVTGLTNGTAYTFELRAKATDAPGESSEVTATPVPAAPANLEASVGVGEVTLEWDDPGDAAITRYQLVHYSGARPSQPSWSDISGSGAGTTSHEVTGLTNGTAYTFELRAKATDAHGDSSAVTATPVPAAPANLNAAGGDGKVTLTWDDPRDAAITVYQLVHYSGSRPSQPTWSDITGSGATTTIHHVMNLTNGTAYTFELRAKARATHGDSSVATATPERRVCPTITVGGLSNQSVTLGQSVSLTASGSGSQGSYWYQLIDTKPETGLTIGEMNGKIEGTPTKTGTYTVKVRVQDENGCSGTGSFTLTVRCPSVSVASISDVSATKGRAMPSRTASASGGPSSFTYTMSGAPAGVGIKTVTDNGKKVGRITGTPEVTGTFRVTVTARNGCGSTGTRQFTITVSCPTINVGGLSNVSATKGQVHAFEDGHGVGRQVAVRLYDVGRAGWCKHKRGQHAR